MSEEINDEIEDVIPVPEIVKTEDDDGNDNTDYKALAEQQREIAEKNRGIAQRNKTRAERFKSKGTNPDGKEPKTKDNVSKSDELDYGQKAFLVANDIKSQDEIKIVKDIMKDTGKTLEQVLESKYFQAELKEFREKKQTADAIPSKTKRSSNSAKDQVEYWLGKKDSNGNYEYPEDRELKMKVIDARRKESSKGNPYRR